ncbi:MAG: ferredoxin, partial [Acinetobacter pittii]|nr:ferredoxin [Acinetobacter pittii]
DAAEAAGFDWPYQERSGNDSTSVARLTSGQVDQSQQTFLVEEQIAAGLIVTAVAWPQSDCALVIDQGEEL